MQGPQKKQVEENKLKLEASSDSKNQEPTHLNKLPLISSEVRLIKYILDEAVYGASKLQQEVPLSIEDRRKIDSIISSLSSARSKANNIEDIASDYQLPISKDDIFWGGVVSIAFYLHAQHWYHEVVELSKDYGKISREVSHQVKEKYRTNVNATNQQNRFFSPTWFTSRANIFGSSIMQTLFHPTTVSHLSKLGRHSGTLFILGAYLYKSAYGLKKAGEALVDRVTPKGP